jgi:site-specific DNA-methyltransferase (adenine-specific)
MKRRLDEYDTLIRWNEAIPILRKVQALHESTLDKVVSSRKPFGLATNFTNFDNINNPDKYKIYANKNIGYVYKTQIQSGKNFINRYKVLLPKANEGSGDIPNRVLTRPTIAEPSSVCTETYIIVKSFDSEQEAINFSKYIKTRFFRFLVFLKKVTQDTTAKVYSFVPDLPMDHEWTDDKLFDRYDITPDEQEYIKSMIKEM